MTNQKHLSGKIGVHLVLLELFKRKIDAIATPEFWPVDIITRHGIMLEVKYANKSKSKGGTGYICERFTCRITPIERNLMDFLIMVLNTQKGYFFYIIPERTIKSNGISFSPFSRQVSKYEKYLDRWDLLKEVHNARRSRKMFQTYLTKHQSYFTALDRFKAEKKREKKYSEGAEMK